jgi:hypothetical protein
MVDSENQGLALGRLPAALCSGPPSCYFPTLLEKAFLRTPTPVHVGVLPDEGMAPPSKSPACAPTMLLKTQHTLIKQTGTFPSGKGPLLSYEDAVNSGGLMVMSEPVGYRLGNQQSPGLVPWILMSLNGSLKLHMQNSQLGA